MFKNIIHNSHQPDRLPKRVQQKLGEGPRVAAQGYGFK